MKNIYHLGTEKYGKFQNVMVNEIEKNTNQKIRYLHNYLSWLGFQFHRYYLYIKVVKVELFAQNFKIFWTSFQKAIGAIAPVDLC